MNEDTLQQEVAAWTALFEAAESREEAEELWSRLIAFGPAGARLRDELMRPWMERWIAEGKIEDTGERGANGQRIYRKR